MEVIGTEANAVSQRWRDQRIDASGYQQKGSSRDLSRLIGRAAVGLGLFGLGLGVAELLLPRRFNRLIGVGDSQRAKNVTRSLGVRELASSFALLGRRRPAPWLWARVAGDVIDLALLANA